MMPESEAIVKQCSMRKVAFFCNMPSHERQDPQSENGLNEKIFDADTVRSRVKHLTVVLLPIILFARYLPLLDRSYFCHISGCNVIALCFRLSAHVTLQTASRRIKRVVAADLDLKVLPYHRSNTRSANYRTCPGFIPDPGSLFKISTRSCGPRISYSSSSASKL